MKNSHPAGQHPPRPQAPRWWPIQCHVHPAHLPLLRYLHPRYHPSRPDQKLGCSLSPTRPVSLPTSTCLPRPHAHLSAHLHQPSAPLPGVPSSDHAARLLKTPPAVAVRVKSRFPAWHAVPATCPLAATAGLLLSPRPSSPRPDLAQPELQAGPASPGWDIHRHLGSFWHPPRPAQQLPRTATFSHSALSHAERWADPLPHLPAAVSLNTSRPAPRCLPAGAPHTRDPAQYASSQTQRVHTEEETRRSRWLGSGSHG